MNSEYPTREPSGSMPADDPAQLIDDLLERVVGVLAGGGAQASEGSDSSGMARVHVGPDGLVSSIELDARLARDRSSVAAALREAVNDALASRPAPPDPAARAAGLRALQDESLTATRRLNASLIGSLEALRRGAE